MAVQTAAAAMLGDHRLAATVRNEAYRPTARSGRPLLDLQQRFVDLRFGMFLHFNMATFQDRECRLQEIGKAWKHSGPMPKLREHVVITTRNLATGKPIHASSYPDTVGPGEANDGDFRSSWYLDEGQTSGWLEVDLGKQETFNVVSLVEPVGRWDDYTQSRIRSYRFEHWNGERWITLKAGEKPAPTTIHRIPRVSSQRVRLLLEAIKETPHIAEIGVYNEPG
jgi:alpha-L-fucosidase